MSREGERDGELSLRRPGRGGEMIFGNVGEELKAIWILMTISTERIVTRRLAIRRMAIRMVIGWMVRVRVRVRCVFAVFY